ncbi:MAG: chemotaxis protein CheA [Thermoanaerobaculia bacterium]|nr:chemotaxis protein CheA [Thermoanaerobaculia bacterium]
MLDAQSMSELRDAFVAESEEGLSSAEAALLVLERMPDDEESLGTVFRAVHTLKGNAGIFDLSALAAVAHSMEELLGRLRERTLLVTPPVVTRLLQGIDVLRGMLHEERRELAGTERELIGSLADLGRKDEPESSKAPSFSSLRKQARTVRIDLARLDRLLDLTGEIGVARGRTTQLLEGDSVQKNPILETHRDGDRLQVELQELVMKLRMVPVGPVFRQLVRTVRDTARALDKEADLHIEGEDVEVDLTIVESLKDPLVHLIRNSLDHGIEKADVRRQLGKKSSGRLVLRSFHDAGSIVIEMLDDGAGLQRDRITALARERGLISADAVLSDDEVYELVFHPGFSTAESVSQVSGRGVGMDVVRRNIESIQGTVSIDSTPGAGTRTTMRLPLTLAVIDGLRVESGGESYVIPMQAVLETIEYKPASGNGSLIALRDETIPVLPLWARNGAGGETPARRNVVIVRHGTGRAGLVVDHLHGECHAVVKPLARPLRGIPGISGSAILPSGRVAFIVDVPGLLQAAIKGAAHVR